MIQTKLIVCALALARHGHFAKAAESLGLSQPSLSRNIAMLEGQLGVKLFDRGTKGVEPTAYGLLLLERGEALIETEESLLREIQLMGGLESGRLVVGAGPYAAEISVGTAVARLVAAHPKLKVRVVTDGPEQIRHGLMARQIDVGVFESGMALKDDPLHAEPLPTHALRLYCRPDHPLTRIAPLTVAGILSYPLVTTLVRGDRAALVIAAGIAAGRAVTAGSGRHTGDFEPAIHVNTLAIASQIASESYAIYPGPLVLAASALKAKRLVQLDFRIPAMQTHYSVNYLRDRSRSPAASTFIDTLHRVENSLKAMELKLESRADRKPSRSTAR
jgi:DNA-binding transcriptional LysR family regulator